MSHTAFGQHNNLKSKTELEVKKQLAIAKSNKDYRLMSKAYKELVYLADKKWNEKYADSMLLSAKQSNDDETIGAAYLTKGTLEYDKKNHSEALDNFITANNYISKTANEYLTFKTKYTIAQIKYYLGFYHEAISLFNECLKYFEEENDLAYLNTIHSLGLCYNKIKKYDKSSYYNKLGLKASHDYENPEMVPYFNHSEGINYYFKKEYKKSINQLTAVLPVLKQKKDFANETVAYFYIGKSYWKLNDTKKAIAYFIKVDNAYTNHQYTRPDLRENYELLIEYYSKHQNAQNQLKYINKLLKVDSTLNHNYKYLSSKIHKEYDTKKLELAKQEIEQSLNYNRKIGVSIITVLLLAIVLLYKHHLDNKKRMKQKFEEFMRGNATKTKSASVDTSKMELDINPELVETILKNLEKFEKNHKYIEKDMTMVKLAPALKTNAKYAAKVILKYRGKKSIEYISDLKIDYIVNLLKTENKYRNYTNKALAEEVGFGSTQNFTKAFNQKMGMSPTFFIQELKKSQQEF